MTEILDSIDGAIRDAITSSQYQIYDIGWANRDELNNNDYNIKQLAYKFKTVLVNLKMETKFFVLYHSDEELPYPFIDIILENKIDIDLDVDNIFELLNHMNKSTSGPVMFYINDSNNLVGRLAVEYPIHLVQINNELIDFLLVQLNEECYCSLENAGLI